MKTIVLSLVCVVLAGPFVRAGIQADVQNRTNTLLQQAGRFYSTGRYDLAIKRCNQILEIDPANFAALAQREIARRQKIADEKPKAGGEKVPRAFHPTFPLQEIGPLSGPDFYK